MAEKIVQLPMFEEYTPVADEFPEEHGIPEKDYEKAEAAADAAKEDVTDRDIKDQLMEDEIEQAMQLSGELYGHIGEMAKLIQSAPPSVVSALIDHMKDRQEDKDADEYENALYQCLLNIPKDVAQDNEAVTWFKDAENKRKANDREPIQDEEVK